MDDSFLQPEPGTSALDHLPGGPVQLAALGVAAAAYRRGRAGLQATIALVVGLVALVFLGWAWALVVSVALVGNLAVAGAFGAIIPLGLRAFRQDPALASGIFLTMITDAMGFLLLLGLATLLIDELT